MEQKKSPQHDNSWKTWLKNLGLVGFLFFLIKGLIWLGIFTWAGKCAFG